MEKKWEARTKSGMCLKECASLLQKALRRGNELEALWAAEELFVSGFERYLLYRLWIIAMEDVGPANIPVVQLASSLYSTWLLHRKERGKEWTLSGENRVINGLLVTAISRSPKCRIADDATQYVMMKRQQGWRIELDNTHVAIDGHCPRGKALGRNLNWWLHRGSKCADLLPDGGPLGRTYKAEVETILRSMAEDAGETLVDPDEEVTRRGLK